jgi:hypothetical protein
LTKEKELSALLVLFKDRKEYIKNSFNIVKKLVKKKALKKAQMPEPGDLDAIEEGDAEHSDPNQISDEEK